MADALIRRLDELDAAYVRQYTDRYGSNATIHTSEVRALLGRPDNDTITGYCPMGCGETLFRGPDGRIACRNLTECADPFAVHKILGDRENEHVVVLRPDDFTTRHPLRERLGDGLMTCEVHEHIANLSGPPAQPGRYRVTGSAPLWTWERLDA